MRPLLAQSAGYRIPYKPKPQSAAPEVALTAQQAYDVARARFPGSTMVRLVLPTAKSPVYLFRLLLPQDARRWAGTSTIAVDPKIGSVTDTYDSRTSPAANRITDDIYSVHTGDAAGVIGRLLVLLAGFTLPTLYATGVYAWASGRRRARQHQGARQREFRRMEGG